MLKKKMIKRRKELLGNDEQIDPMIYAVNMVDCMLVLAVGFLIFTIIFMNSGPNEASSKVNVEMGQVINDTDQTTTGSETGYDQVGKVYKDPETGKLVMIKDT
ncbi:MAG: DUF2149 domain-containing protein [Methanobacterium sp.]|nr:DUF2149 domain-containing protein [Methanobacterium sp.]